MKLFNTTSWNSGDLTSLLKAGLKAKGVDHSKYAVVVTLSHTKRDIEDSVERGAEHWVGADGKALHGYACLEPVWSIYLQGKRILLRNKSYIRMFLPDGDFDLKKFAQIFEHEIDHTLGLKHRDMIDSDLLEPKWHEGFTLNK